MNPKVCFYSFWLLQTLWYIFSHTSPYVHVRIWIGATQEKYNLNYMCNVKVASSYIKEKSEKKN